MILFENKKNIDFDFDSIQIEKIKKGASVRLTNKRIRDESQNIIYYQERLQQMCKKQYFKDLFDIDTKFGECIHSYKC